jgi:transcriptional regulator with XRE-family HTH domain
MAAEKKTPTRTEREAGIKRGYMTRLKSGGVAAPTPETIRQLADYLRVSYEWLAIGRGPMRQDGWASSPLEEAMLFARRNGAREDAMLAAAERYRDDETVVTAWDWVMVFDAETRRLERAGVARPEVLAKKQASFRRVGAKKRRQKTAAEEAAADARRQAELAAAVSKQNRADRDGPARKPRRA